MIKVNSCCSLDLLFAEFLFYGGNGQHLICLNENYRKDLYKERIENKGLSWQGYLFLVNKKENSIRSKKTLNVFFVL